MSRVLALETIGIGELSKGGSIRTRRLIEAVNGGPYQDTGILEVGLRQTSSCDWDRTYWLGETGFATLDEAVAALDGAPAPEAA